MAVRSQRRTSALGRSPTVGIRPVAVVYDCLLLGSTIEYKLLAG